MSGLIRISNGAPNTANSRRPFFSSSLLALLGSNSGYHPDRRLCNHDNLLCMNTAPNAASAALGALIK